MARRAQLEVPARLGPNLFRWGGGRKSMKRAEPRLFRFRVELEDPSIGDDRRRSASGETRTLSPIAPVAVPRRGHVGDPLDEPVLRVVEEHDEARGQGCDVGGASAPGEGEGGGGGGGGGSGPA